MLDFDAGRYAAYVWPAFIISAVVIAGLIADSLARSRKWRRLAQTLDKAGQ